MDEIMNASSRERFAHKILYSYQNNKDAIQKFMSKAYRYNYKTTDDPQIRSTFKSDPTARGAMLLLDPPDYIRNAILMVETVEAAWQEVRELDCGEQFGYSYLMEKNFCLTGKQRDRSENARMRHKICSDCGIAERTFYAWMWQITEIVVYHATKRGLM